MMFSVVLFVLAACANAQASIPRATGYTARPGYEPHGGWVHSDNSACNNDGCQARPYANFNTDFCSQLNTATSPMACKDGPNFWDDNTRCAGNGAMCQTQCNSFSDSLFFSEAAVQWCANLCDAQENCNSFLMVSGYTNNCLLSNRGLAAGVEPQSQYRTGWCNGEFRKWWYTKGVAAVAPAWTRFAHCEGRSSTGRKDFSTEVIMEMAKSASRIKICTKGNSNDCITSVANSDPIKALREGRTLNWNGNVCDATCTSLTWEGTQSRVANAVATCNGGISGNGEGALEGTNTNGNCWGSGGNCLFQTSCNGNGLHVGLGDGSSCGWGVSTSDNLEFFFDYTVQNTGPVPFSIKFGGQAWGMAKSTDNGATWTPIATVDMHTYQHTHMIGEVRDVAQEGMIIKFQPLYDQLASDLGYLCPVLHDKCDGTCTFDANRDNCFNWDYARIFLHELKIDGQEQDFSDLNVMESNGWNFQCRTNPETCDPSMTIKHFSDGRDMVRQDGANFYYTYTFTGIGGVATVSPTARPTFSPTMTPTNFPTVEDFIIKVKGFHGKPEDILNENKIQGQRDVDIDMYGFERKLTPISRRLLKRKSN